MRLLFIENRDSFSWNVVDRLPCRRADVTLVDGLDRARIDEEMSRSDAMVIGPGPLDPLRAGLLEVVAAAVRRALPTLGICLGHQALGVAFGAKLVRTPPAHGRRDSAVFQPSRLFPGIVGPLAVMRYHSLSLAEIGAPLDVVARTPDGLPMAIAHRTLPFAGLQFHPDSFATPRGEELLAAFFRAVS
jgi:anthranilate synthase